MRENSIGLTSASLIWLNIVLMVLMAPDVFAQATFTGALLRGRVQDTSQSLVPRATVTVTNDATRVSQKTTTDEEGRYVFNFLQPASYAVQVEAQGFKTFVRQGVVLRVGQQTDLDFTLEVGEVTTTVEITAASPVLNSVSAALGQEVDNRYVTEVPLFDRQVLNLAYLAPGVSEPQPKPVFGTTGINFVSNGQRNSSAEVRLDGALISAGEGGGGGTSMVKYSPSIEIIQEFKVVNNSLSAEYGNNGGTIMTIVTKSGTNSFHGSGYWFGRRNALDANDFFANRAGVPKPTFRRDQYGGSIGGPIVKEKTFFFFDYDRTRFESPATLTTSVPTALQKNGDFSQTFNANGTLRQVFNPFDVFTDVDGSIKRRPFPNNIIPRSLMDPVALNLMTYFPDPTGPGDPRTGLNNYTKTAVTSNPSWQFDIKIDHIISARSRFSGRYSRGFRGGNSPIYYGNAADDSLTETNNSNNGVLEYTQTLGSNAVWTVRGGLERFIQRIVPQEFNPTQLGFPSVLREGGIDVFPRIDTTSYASLGPFGPVMDAHTLPHYGSSLNVVIHSHNIKVGGEQRIFFKNYYAPAVPSGHFRFNPATTAEAVFAPSGTQGNGIASLLLGWSVGNRMAFQPHSANKSKETAFYIQDDWRITPQFTLNLGLRYEWSTPYTERFDRLQIADFDANAGVNVPGIGDIKGVARFVDSDSRSVAADHNNFAPRIGFAYRLNKKTVVRGGAGIYYNISAAQNFWLIGGAFRSNAPIVSTLDGGVTRFASLSNPYPNGFLYPQGRRYGNMALWGLTGSANADEEFRNGELYQWNFGMQHELPGTILVEAVYSGSRGVHLPNGWAQNHNVISRQNREAHGSQGLSASVPNPFQPFFNGPNAVINLPPSIYNNATVARINLLRPFPQFPGTFLGFLPPIGTSRYDSVQFRIEKRYSHGIHFLGSYTFAKALEDSQPANPYLIGGAGLGAAPQDLTNLRAEWGTATVDTPHRLVWSWGYELPFGRGKPVGRGMSRGLDALIGGWQFNGFLTFQTGLPLYMGLANPRLADGNQRPNIDGNPLGASIKDTVDGKGIRFNSSAFSAPPDQRPGNASAVSSIVRGDWLHNLDLSVFKNARIKENMQVQVRAEFFNFTNTPRFGDPTVLFGSATFGQINSQVNTPRRVQMGVRFLF